MRDNIKIKHFKKSVDKCDILYDNNYYEDYELSEISSKFYHYYRIFFCPEWIKSNFIKLQLLNMEHTKSMYIIYVENEYVKYYPQNNIEDFIKTHTYKYILNEKLSNEIENFILKERVMITLNSAIQKIRKIKCIQAIENNIKKLLYYVPNSIKTVNIEQGFEYCKNLNNKLNLLLIKKDCVSKYSRKIKLPKHCTIIIENLSITENIPIILKKINFKLCIIGNIKQYQLF